MIHGFWGEFNGSSVMLWGMRSSVVFAVFASLLSVSAYGYQLSAGDAKIVESARARYYNLSAAGFQSLHCSVKFDFATVPLLPSATDESMRKLLEATGFTLVLDDRGRPSLQHRYPADAGESLRQQASQEINLLSSFVVGVLQTWPTKGLQGPIPSFDSQIESVESTDRGYTISLRVPGGPVKLLLDKSYLVTEIVSAAGKIHERPVYTPSPEGLVFVGNDGIDDSEQGGRVEVKYDLGTSVLDGLRVPSSAHIRVNQNIDVKFVLDGCVVQKAKVLEIDPPPISEKPSM
jgi:hypothetical protein